MSRHQRIALERAKFWFRWVMVIPAALFGYWIGGLMGASNIWPISEIDPDGDSLWHAIFGVLLAPAAYLLMGTAMAPDRRYWFKTYIFLAGGFLIFMGVNIANAVRHWQGTTQSWLLIIAPAGQIVVVTLMAKAAPDKVWGDDKFRDFRVSRARDNYRSVVAQHPEKQWQPFDSLSRLRKLAWYRRNPFPDDKHFLRDRKVP